jgi:phosphate starvation-inducible PhoH-like protein
MIKPKKSSKTQKSNVLNFDIKKIYPKTENQQRVFDFYDAGKHLLLSGVPGSGKTFLASYFALRDTIETSLYNKIIIIRSSCPTREIGFLPGDVQEKMDVYLTPYRTIINDLFGRDDAFDILHKKGIIETESTSFLRGITYSNCFIIADEVQNFSLHEFSTVISRLGENSKIILCGDFQQSDLNPKKELSGILDFAKIADIMKEFEQVDFTVDDIVRSDIVKSFIIAKLKLNL